MFGKAKQIVARLLRGAHEKPVLSCQNAELRSQVLQADPVQAARHEAMRQARYAKAPPIGAERRVTFEQGNRSESRTTLQL